MSLYNLYNFTTIHCSIAYKLCIWAKITQYDICPLLIFHTMIEECFRFRILCCLYLLGRLFPVHPCDLRKSEKISIQARGTTVDSSALFQSLITPNRVHMHTQWNIYIVGIYVYRSIHLNIFQPNSCFRNDWSAVPFGIE